jgi:hypothetical protein
MRRVAASPVDRIVNASTRAPTLPRTWRLGSATRLGPVRPRGKSRLKPGTGLPAYRTWVRESAESFVQHHICPRSALGHNCAVGPVRSPRSWDSDDGPLTAESRDVTRICRNEADPDRVSPVEQREMKFVRGFPRHLARFRVPGVAGSGRRARVSVKQPIRWCDELLSSARV